MKRTLMLILTLFILPAMVFPAAVSDKTERIVLAIGETTYRSAPRMSGEDQLGIWKTGSAWNSGMFT